ncbi:MAG: hypothetical protein LUO89_02100 [Methanothrix sp.]|nr:hypothetical protein [Methanothrix sp.]
MPDNPENLPSREMILGILAQTQGFSLNVRDDYLVISEDKLHIHITKTLDKAKRRRDWITPLGISVSLLMAVLAADTFRSFIFPPSVWKLIFINGLILALVWLVISLLKCSKPETVDQIIERIKKEPR